MYFIILYVIRVFDYIIVSKSPKNVKYNFYSEKVIAIQSI